MTKEGIKFTNAALDEDDKGSIVLRGVIAPESMVLLKVGPYQREVLPLTKIQDLMKAYETGSVPDVELGMRGGGFTEKNELFFLNDEIYIIDGLQRITAAMRYMDGTRSPKLGATVHFNTTEDWERERFRILNTMHLRLSANVLIRNLEKESEIVGLLRSLCKDRNFVLHDKVCWNQRMSRNELISANVFLSVTGIIHSRFGPTRTSTFNDLIINLDGVYVKLGRNIVRENIKTFWDFMDECYKVRFITFKEGAIYLKRGFLAVMASVLAEHGDFWKDARLFIDRDLRKKFSSFPINDGEVIRLAGSGGAATEILYMLIVNHINSGKRTKRLVPSKKSFRVTPQGRLINEK